MNDISEALRQLGFDPWFEEQVDVRGRGPLAIARVVAVHKERCTISNGVVDVPAELLGKLVYSAGSPLDFPAVGDWVLASFYDDDTLAIIHHILPRKTVLKRKTPGKKVDFQLIAVNIDTAFIVQSLDDNFNVPRLERYLVMINEGDIRPIVLLSKSDLLDGEQIARKVGEIKRIMPDLGVYPFSSRSEAGLPDVAALLCAAHTYCLVGSSGVGKTTLLNHLVGEARFKTREVRERDGKGKHATTHRQLIALEGGAMVVDTPGMRELGAIDVQSGLDETFAEITALAGQCRFNDCTHVHEHGCAVLRAVEDGELSQKRYQNYIKMHRESAYHDMSYLEKRRKDKHFGKMVKDVMKHKKSKR